MRSVQFMLVVAFDSFQMSKNEAYSSSFLDKG